MRAFLDTSSLLKLYYKEADSAALKQQLQPDQALIVAELTWVEMHSAFQMKVRQAVLTQALADHRLCLLANDWGSFSRITLNRQLLMRSARLVQKHQRFALRSLDAIQLAAALAAGPLDAFFTHDQRLADAAQAEGLPVR